MGREPNDWLRHTVAIAALAATPASQGCSPKATPSSAPPDAGETQNPVVSWNLGNDALPSELAVYGDGEALVAGHYHSGDGEQNGFLHRLNKNGDEIFRTKFGGPEDEEVRTVAVDADDNAWVATVDDQQTSEQRGSLHKFDAKGNLMFTVPVYCASCVRALAATAGGEVWLAGELLLAATDAGSSIPREGRLQKFSASGEPTLATSFGDAESTVGGPVALEGDADVWVFGAQMAELENYHWTATVFHFSSDGELQGQFAIESERSALPASIRVDEFETLWLATSELDDTKVYFTLRGYSKAGTLVFEREEETLTGGVLATAPSGNVWSLNTGSDSLLREYARDGRILRTMPLDELTAVPWGSVFAVAFDADAGVWFAGGAALTDGFAMWHEPL